MADIHFLPGVERLILFEDSALTHVFTTLDIKINAPTLYNYVHKLLEYPLFKPYVCKTTAYNKMLQELVDSPPGVRPPLKLSYFE